MLVFSLLYQLTKPYRSSGIGLKITHIGGTICLAVWCHHGITGSMRTLYFLTEVWHFVGRPLCKIISNLFMNHSETLACDGNHKSLIQLQCVCDTFCGLGRSLEEFFCHVSRLTLTASIQFTKNVQLDTIIHILDVTVLRQEPGLITKIYTSVHSSHYLKVNLECSHPPSF